MHGMQRIPALCVNKPFSGLHELNLADYEVLSCETLHDIAGHIKKLFTELPQSLTKSAKSLFETSLNGAFGKKEAKRGCDYRSTLIKICVQIKGL